MSDDDADRGLFEPGAQCAMPGCEIGLIDDHTFRQYREHNPRLDLPWQATPSDVPDQTLDGWLLAGAVLVKGMVVKIPNPGPGMRPMHPALGFTFYGADQATPVAEVALVADSKTLRDLRTIVGSAIDGAITAARRGRVS